MFSHTWTYRTIKLHPSVFKCANQAMGQPSTVPSEKQKARDPLSFFLFLLPALRRLRLSHQRTTNPIALYSLLCVCGCGLKEATMASTEEGQARISFSMKFKNISKDIVCMSKSRKRVTLHEGQWLSNQGGSQKCLKVQVGLHLFVQTPEFSTNCSRFIRLGRDYILEALIWKDFKAFLTKGDIQT